MSVCRRHWNIFDQYILQLEKLIEPVAQCLLPFLERWAAKSEPLFQEWEAYFAQQDLQMWLKKPLPAKHL